LIFLLEKRPFSLQTLNEYRGFKDNKSPNSPGNIKLKSSLLGTGINVSITDSKNSPTSSPRILIKSPNITSKFLPTEKLKKSPAMQNKTLEVSDSKNENLKGLSKYSMPGVGVKKPVISTGVSINVIDPNAVPVNRKQRNILTNLEDAINKEVNEKTLKTDFSNLTLEKAVKYNNKDSALNLKGL